MLHEITPGVGHRPSLRTRRGAARLTEEEQASARRTAVAEARQASGRNLFTGKRLAGDDAVQWLRHWAGLPVEFIATEAEPREWDHQLAELLHCTNDRVDYRRTDGNVVSLCRTVTSVVVKGRRRRVVKVDLLGVSGGSVAAGGAAKAVVETGAVCAA